MEDSVVDSLMTGDTPGKLTVIFHECEGSAGFVAECIELPGCFSEGETQDEAERNIIEAIDACLSVLFEDCLKDLRSRVDFASVNMRGVSKQERFTVKTPRLELPAYA